VDCPVGYLIQDIVPYLTDLSLDPLILSHDVRRAELRVSGSSRSVKEAWKESRDVRDEAERFAV